MQTTRRMRGQVTVEMAIGLLAVLAAVVMLGYVYTQRAMQGYTFEANQSLDTPADPRDGFTDVSRSSMSDSTRQQPSHAMIEARIPKTKSPGTGNAAWDNAMTLGSLPAGPVPREPASWRAIQSNANWSSSQSSNADVWYDNN